MKNFKNGLLGIFLTMIAIVYPLPDRLDDSSVEKLQQIIALSNQKTEKTQKKRNFVQQVYSKAKKIAKKPYVKKLFYLGIGLTICILATYASYDGVLTEPIKEPELVPDDKELESLPPKSQEIIVTKNNPELKNLQNNKPLIPEAAPEQVPTQSDHQDNLPPIIKPNEVNPTNEILDKQPVNVHSIPSNPIIPQENLDSNQISANIIDKSLKNPIIKEPQNLGDDIDKKKKRYYELRWEDDLDFDQYHEFMELRNELSVKGLL